MRKRILGALCFLCAVVIGCFGCNQVTGYAATESQAECVIDCESLTFLHTKNADARLPMASTTKILTAIIIIEDCDPDEIVSVPKQAELAGGSSVYLREGDQISVRDLLYGLMLRSGNDCAVSLAICHSGDLKAFSQVMNERAMRMGAEHSHFCNPHGMPDENHYTTARDLAIISAYAMQNEMFREIVSCQYYQAKSWKNKNKMLFDYDGAIGIKTGFTTRAGRCLVTAAQRDNRIIVCVVLNSPQMYERTEELLNRAFEK